MRLPLLREWETEIETMLGDGGPMEIMRDWGAKLAGATLRLAAVLHCVRHGCGCINRRPDLRGGCRDRPVSIPHAEAVMALMQAKEGRATMTPGTCCGGSSGMAGGSSPKRGAAPRQAAISKGG